jgi:transposase
MRRVWLRGREKVQKRYLMHVAGYNLGLIMRLLIGAGTPRDFHARACVSLVMTWAIEGILVVMIFVVCGDQFAAFGVMIRPKPVG